MLGLFFVWALLMDDSIEGRVTNATSGWFLVMSSTQGRWKTFRPHNRRGSSFQDIYFTLKIEGEDEKTKKKITNHPISPNPIRNISSFLPLINIQAREGLHAEVRAL